MKKKKWADLTGRIEDIISNRKSLIGTDRDIELLAQSYAAKIIDKQSSNAEDKETPLKRYILLST